MHRAAISLLVLACLGLQVLAISRLLSAPRAWNGAYGVRWMRSSATWPFIDYPMYDEAHRAGEAIPTSEIVATAEDGSEICLRPEDRTVVPRVGALLVALIRGDRRRADGYCESWRSRHGLRLVSLRLEPHPLELTRDGFVPAANVAHDAR